MLPFYESSSYANQNIIDYQTWTIPTANIYNNDSIVHLSKQATGLSGWLYTVSTIYKYIIIDCFYRNTIKMDIIKYYSITHKYINP